MSKSQFRAVFSEVRAWAKFYEGNPRPDSGCQDFRAASNAAWVACGEDQATHDRLRRAAALCYNLREEEPHGFQEKLAAVKAEKSFLAFIKG